MYISVSGNYIPYRPTFKCEDAINVNANFLQLLETQLKYDYIRGDESRRAQNAIIEFAKRMQSFYYAFKCGPTVYSYKTI